MQHIQDKEFDQLFKDKFDGVEIQPSSDLWNNISEKLVPKRKRAIPVYWMAAAVVFVLLTIGLMTLPKSEKIRLQAPALTVINTETSKSIAKVKVSPVKEEYKSTPLIIAPRLKVGHNEKKDLIAMQPKASVTRPDYIQSKIKEPLEAEPKKNIVRDNEVMMANTDLHAPDETDQDVINEIEEPEHKKIRNVGDLVNFVVNKVDKREKKFIQFDTDDDNSSLVSINIGFIKLNKKLDR